MYNLLEGTMAHMNWKDIEDAGKKKLPVLFPLGVIEEHGPHLPLASDIIWSSFICKEVQKELGKQEREVLIAPPYYYGVNHCTGAFPGSFSLKPETFSQVLFELFENLHGFGFEEIYCFNYHGDSVHIGSILKAIIRANTELHMKIKYVIEAMDLELHQLKGDEDFLSVFAPQYVPEWFEGMGDNEEGLLDIHAGAFETGILNRICPEFVNTALAKNLQSYSLSWENLEKWLAGGESTVSVVPLGYAGNPMGYEAVAGIAGDIIKVQVEAICKGIL